MCITESLAHQGRAGECEADSEFPASPAVFLLPAQRRVAGGLASAWRADAGIRAFFVTGFIEFRAWRVGPGKAARGRVCRCFLFILNRPQVAAHCWVLLQQRAQQQLGNLSNSQRQLRGPMGAISALGGTLNAWTDCLPESTCGVLIAPGTKTSVPHSFFFFFFFDESMTLASLFKAALVSF